jgi:hypothetical protein
MVSRGKSIEIEPTDTMDKVYRKVAKAVYGNVNARIKIEHLKTLEEDDAHGKENRHKDYVLRDGVTLTLTMIEPDQELKADKIFQEADVINVSERGFEIYQGALRGGARNYRRKSRRKSSRRKSKRKIKRKSIGLKSKRKSRKRR